MTIAILCAWFGVGFECLPFIDLASCEAAGMLLHPTIGVQTWKSRSDSPKGDRPMTIRGNILATAREYTEEDRNKEYGDPYPQLGLAGLLKALLREHHSVHGLRMLGPAEWEAIDMICTKISRVILGQVKQDTYIDLAAYAAIAGECAARFGKLNEQQNTED